ncbi:ferric reduction oxidase 7, partial [Quercus suber]
FGSELYADWIGATNESLFGYTGSYLLLYSGPIIIIAFLAVPYLLISGEDQLQLQEKKTPRFRLWTFPVLLDGPLGVVSAAELIGIILFIVFVICDVYVHTAVILGTLTDDMDPLDLWYDIFADHPLPVAAATASSSPVSQHKSRFFFTLTQHKCFLFSMFQWVDLSVSHFPGVISLAVGLLMWMTSLHPVRKKKFEFILLHSSIICNLYCLFSFACWAFLVLCICWRNISFHSRSLFEILPIMKDC